MKPETRIKIDELVFECLTIIDDGLKNPTKKENGCVDFDPILVKAENEILLPYLKKYPSHKTIVDHAAREITTTLMDSIESATESIAKDAK